MTLVIFDLGETLVSYSGIALNWSKHYSAAISQALEGSGKSATPHDMERAMSILEAFNTRLNPRVIEVNEGEVLQRAGKLFGVDEVAFERQFFAYFQRKATIEPTALETLLTLKAAHVHTAVLSDVPYGMPREFMIDDLGPLAPHFDAIVSSCDIGTRKPHPRGILTLINQFKCAPEKAYYIGNEEKDMICAAEAGINPVLISPVTTRNYGQAHSIQTLSEIAHHVL